MTKVIIDIPPELNRKIDIKRAQEGDKRKEITINRILEEYFDNNSKFRPATPLNSLPKGVKPPYLLKEDLDEMTQEEREAWKKNHQSK